MSGIPEKARADLQKILGLLESDFEGERDAAVRAATRLLDRHGIKWCEILSLLPSRPAPATRETPVPTWRVICQKLAARPGDLRRWERQFVTDLPGFPRISAKQRYILDEIAARVLRRRAA